MNKIKQIESVMAKNRTGNKRFWTKERVLAALTSAAAEIKGPLPCSDAKWNEIKKGRFDWPSAMRILEYFGSMARAWLAAGAKKERVSLRNIAWTLEEDDYLKTYAGSIKLATIAKHLCRSYDSVKVRLNKHHGIHARANQGYLSAALLSKEYQCPYHRVRTALAEGKIKGKYDKVRNRWEVDLFELTPEAEEILRAPKERSYKNSPPDLGDYYQRYGIRRMLVGGQIVRIEGTLATV